MIAKKLFLKKVGAVGKVERVILISLMFATDADEAIDAPDAGIDV